MPYSNLFGAVGNLLVDFLDDLQVAAFDRTLLTGKVSYGTQWAKMLGYSLNEIDNDISAFEKLIFAEDVDDVKALMQKQIDDKEEFLQIEFRMVCKNDKVIWMQSQSRIIEFSKDGAASRVVVICHDLTMLKEVQNNFKLSREFFHMAVDAAGLGVYDLDIKTNLLKYSDAYLSMLGYEKGDLTGEPGEWQTIVHPDDLPVLEKTLEDYINGLADKYVVEARFRHKDGGYIWLKSVGRCIEFDDQGNATRLIGGHFNINALKISQQELQNNKIELEQEVENRTCELVKQDEMLWTVNEIARNLLATRTNKTFDDIVSECLFLIGNVTAQSRVFIWKNFFDEELNELCCTQIYELTKDIFSVQDFKELEKVPYTMLPAFLKAINTDTCLNNLVCNLDDAEKKVLEPQAIKSILIAPINISGNKWGFIGIDNCTTEELFSDVEESMLRMSGFLLASAIEKRQIEYKRNQEQEMNMVLFEYLPLCCKLWDKDFRLITCNHEALKLFGFTDKKELMERYFDLLPEFQPNGQKSKDELLQYLKQALEEGKCKIQWTYRKFSGEPILVEQDLIRIKYKGEHAVAVYTRDLRDVVAAQKQVREAEERNQLMLNTMPLCCNLWQKVGDDIANIACNDESVRLFELDSQEEYLKCFHELSPQFQPNGQLSSYLSQVYIEQAFKEGHCSFGWTHQKLDGEQIPSEITLVRVAYKDDYIVIGYTRDLREVLAAQEQIREAEERSQLMLNASPVCSTLWDRNLNIIDCNDAALRMFKVRSKEEFAVNFGILSPKVQPGGEDTYELFKEYMTRIFKEVSLEFEWVHCDLYGEPIPVMINLYRIKYKDDYAVLTYITDQRRIRTMLEEIKVARDEALAHSKAKSGFLAKMSHEIRTPMNAIVGMTELLLREEVNKKAIEYANGIKQAGDNLLSVINDILDFSKIESGRLEIVEAPYLLSSLVNDVVSIIRIRLMDKQVAFVVEIDPDLPNAICGDEARIRQAVLNILGNAVKYTKEGHISLKVFGERVSDDTFMLNFRVQDTGIGIQEEDLKNLFQEFTQFDFVTNKGVEGTGLGLAIAKNFCQAMGGDIIVDSIYGNGSTFLITVPQVIQSQEKIAKVQNPEKHNVLVCEPRRIYAQSISNALKALKVSHTVVTMQSEYYNNLSAQKYNFIFMAPFLTTNVLQVVRRLSSKAQMVVLAEYGDVIDEPDMKMISMPVHSIFIANVLNEKYDDNAYNRNRYTNVAFVAPTARALIVDDISTNLKVAEGLISPFGLQIDTCESGAEAIALIGKNHYDIIFMDHMMPDMDGIETTLKIRKELNLLNVPIIALTANAIIGVREMFLANGFNDFLSKPIEMKKLNEILENWVPKEKQEKYVDQITTEESCELEITDIDIATGISLTGGSAENYLKVLSIFCKDGINQIRLISKFLQEKNILSITNSSHALKSALATIGAVNLSELAKRLEQAGKNNSWEYIKDNIPYFLTELDLLIANIQEKIATDDQQLDVVIDENQIKRELIDLKEALETFNAIAADKIVNSISKKPLNDHYKKAVEKISERLLISEYEEAVQIIDKLIV